MTIVFRLIIAGAVFLSAGLSPAARAQEPAGTEPASAGKIRTAEVVPIVPPPEGTDRVSLDFRQAEIRSVLQVLARKAGVNIVSTESVAGEISIRLENVTWEQALDAVVKTAGLAYDQQHNIILVSTVEELKARRQAEQELGAIESVTTRVLQLQYLDAVDVKNFLEPQLSPQGRISVLEMTGQKGWTFGTASAGGGAGEPERAQREKARSKSVVITDTPSALDRLEEIVAAIDIRPKQILIESKVMEVNRDLLRDLGLEFGTGTGSTNTGSTSGFVSGTGRTFSQQSLDKTDTGTGDRASFGGSTLNQFLSPSIFVPETTGLTAANAGLSLVFQKLRGTQFEVLLRALEEDVRSNTLSAPHVLTLSGQEAKILVGTKYPILKTQVSGSESTTTTTSLDYYQDIGIELFVVPQVSGEDHIDMIVHPVVSSFSSTVGSNAYPILDIREAETQIVMQSGETVVIGGLLKDVKAKSRVGLPFLGKLPILGPLFSRSTTDVEKIDLLIFITATIVEPGTLTPEEQARLRERYEAFLRDRLTSNDEAAPSLPAQSPPPQSAERPDRGGNRGVLHKNP